MSKGNGGKPENFAITTDGHWKLELPIMLAELLFNWICKVHWQMSLMHEQIEN